MLECLKEEVFHSDLSEARFEKTEWNVMVPFANDTNSNLLKTAKTTDVVVLQVIYCLTFVSIIVVNIILLWRLIFRLKKTRFNILFIFISMSDIPVALTLFYPLWRTYSIQLFSLWIFMDIDECNSTWQMSHNNSKS